MVQQLHKVECPRELIVLASVLDQLDKDFIEFELLCGDLVGSQFVGAKRIPQSVEVERLNSESITFVNTLTQRTRGGDALLFHGTFLGIRSPERHPELQVLDERSRPARVLLSSLIA